MLLTCSASGSVWDTRQQAQLAIQAGLEQLERPEAVPLATLGVEAALQQTRDEAPDGAAAATPAVRDEDKLATPIQMRTALVLPFCHYLGRVGSTGTHGRRPKSNRKSVAFPAPACPPPSPHDATEMLQVLKNARFCLYLSRCFNVPLRKWYIAMKKSTCEIFKGKHT